MLLALLLAPAALLAQDGAKLAPPDTGVFVQLDDLAKIRADFENDRLVEMLRRQLAPPRENEAWQLLQAALGLNTQQIIDAYFGKSLVVIGSEPGDGNPGVILSRVAKADAAAAVQKLGLVEVEQAGDFTIYTNDEDNARIAFSDEWMAMANVLHSDYMVQVLSHKAGEKSLADDAAFKAWMSKLPEQRVGVAYIRKSDPDETHALAVTRQGADLSLHYVGVTPQIKTFLAGADNSGQMNWGPLPTSTLAALTFNFQGHGPKDTRILDRLIAPKSFTKDVLPKIGPSIAVFFGNVPGEQLQPASDAGYPVVGVAVQMKDSSIAAELDKVVNGAMLLVNMQTMNWGTDPLAMGAGEHRGVSYRTAGLGAVLAERARRQELKPITLTYGAAGGWYVLASQEQFFKQIADTAAGQATALGQSQAFKKLGLEAQEGLLATMFIQGPELARDLQPWLRRWRQQGPPGPRGMGPPRDGDELEGPGPDRQRPPRRGPDGRPPLRGPEGGGPRGPGGPGAGPPFPSPEARLMRPLMIAATILEHYESVSAQLLRGDGETAVIKVQLKRKAAQVPAKTQE
ncbi:MAG: hypothetical protein WD042_03370 [Phycisphaeraceae bacterium]